MKKTMITITTALFVALCVLPAYSEDNPFWAPNNSWIKLSGTVVEASGNSFKLDFGEGLITVTMNDWDWYEERYQQLEGDDVSVYGYVDGDLYETTTIEAATVYVENLHSYFYARSSSPSGQRTIPVSKEIFIDSELELTGKVTKVQGREFIIDADGLEIQVDTSTMEYNPMDDKGYQKIKRGDYVQVHGELDLDLFERKEILADTIISLVEEERL